MKMEEHDWRLHQLSQQLARRDKKVLARRARKLLQLQPIVEDEEEDSDDEIIVHEARATLAGGLPRQPQRRQRRRRMIEREQEDADEFAAERLDPPPTYADFTAGKFGSKVEIDGVAVVKYGEASVERSPLDVVSGLELVHRPASGSLSNGPYIILRPGAGLKARRAPRRRAGARASYACGVDHQQQRRLEARNAAFAAAAATTTMTADDGGGDASEDDVDVDAADGRISNDDDADDIMRAAVHLLWRGGLDPAPGAGELCAVAEVELLGVLLAVTATNTPARARRCRRRSDDVDDLHETVGALEEEREVGSQCNQLMRASLRRSGR